MKFFRFYRFVSHHRLLCTTLFAILPFSICAASLATISAGPGAYVIVALLFFLLCNIFCKSCANQLILYATKELNDNCDPNPLLEETLDGLKYVKKGVDRQIYIIDYSTALSALGEHEFAYRQLSEINIDKYAGTLPVVKIVYYNNLGYFAHILKKDDAADLMHNKALAMYNELKEGKQKKELEFTLLSSQASACLRAGDPIGALSYANRLSPPSKYGEIETAWLFSEIYLAQNDTLSAKKYLEKVASSNPCLYIVKEAKRLLAEME